MVKEKSKSHPISHQQVLWTQLPRGEGEGYIHDFWIDPSLPIKFLCSLKPDRGQGLSFPSLNFQGLLRTKHTPP